MRISSLHRSSSRLERELRRHRPHADEIGVSFPSGVFRPQHDKRIFLLPVTFFALQELRRRLPALSELPVTHIPGNAEDERYPALGWQAFAAQRMVQR